MSLSSIGKITELSCATFHDLQCESLSQVLDVDSKSSLMLAAITFICSCLAFLAPAGAVTPVEITPHRAAYTFEMLSSEPSGGVSGVTGGMTFEWADACDGWALDQHYLIRITNNDGTNTEIRTSNATWESKDGLRYRFSVKRGRDGKLVEDLRGDARLEAAGSSGVVAFSRPKQEKIPLPEGTKFPTDFMLEQMRAARDGSSMPPKLVFEGGAMEGPQSVTTMILPRRAPSKSGVLKEPLGPNDVWPIYVAYFPAGNPGGTAETELTIEIQANGIVPSFVLDYGIFKLRAVLARVSALPDAGC